MSEPVRLIKKYPNRRLYDTKTSAYITLGDVKDLVIKFEVFKNQFRNFLLTYFSTNFIMT